MAAMRVILFGASGMVGQGVLRECLLDADVSEVLAVVRSPLDRRDPKLRELAHKDFTDFSGVDFSGYDACFWCLGISSVGMSEVDYTRITYDYTVAAAAQMAPSIAFIFVSGAGTGGASMWARVKKKAEDAVLARFAKGYAFRPAFIQPMH